MEITLISVEPVYAVLTMLVMRYFVTVGSSLIGLLLASTYWLTDPAAPPVWRGAQTIGLQAVQPVALRFTYAPPPEITPESPVLVTALEPTLKSEREPILKSERDVQTARKKIA